MWTEGSFSSVSAACLQPLGTHCNHVLLGTVEPGGESEIEHASIYLSFIRPSSVNNAALRFTGVRRSIPALSVWSRSNSLRLKPSDPHTTKQPRSHSQLQTVQSGKPLNLEYWRSPDAPGCFEPAIFLLWSCSVSESFPIDYTSCPGQNPLQSSASSCEKY